MSECTDYWCEHYGKASGQCDRCANKDSVKDSQDIRMILKKRADKLMELDESNVHKKGGIRR